MGTYATFDPRMTRDIVIDIDTTLTTCCAQIEVNFEGTFTTIAHIESLLQPEICAARFIGQADVGTTGFTITSSGVYKLSQNIIFNPVGSAAAITINADNVLLDLQCFTITQGNTAANVDGIAISANLSSIIVHNGKIKKFTRDGIRVASGVTNVAYANITIQNCLYGIFCLGTNISPIEDMQALELDLLNNSTGISLTFVNRAAISESVFFGNAHAGIELITSFSNNIDSCSIEETGAANGSAFGVSMINGGNNRVQNCYIDGVSTNDTFSGNSAVGILLGAIENDDLILNNQISNCTTTSNAQPFGIEMLYTTTNILSNSGLPVVTGSGDTTSVVWSPNDRYLAVAGATLDTVQVFEFANNTLKLIAQVTQAGITGDLAWSPDGQFLASTDGATLLRIYQFDGASLVLRGTFTGTSNVESGFSWSHNGKYIALGSTAAPAQCEIVKVSINGDSVILTSVTLVTGGDLATWSFDDEFIALRAGGVVQVYAFNGNSLTLVASFSAPGLLNLQWSPNGKYIAFASTSIGVLLFNGTSLTLVASFASGANAVKWSSDGNYIATDAGVSGVVRVLQFVGNALINIESIASGGSPQHTPAWNNSGTIIAVDSGPVGTNAQLYSGLQFPSGSLLQNNEISNVNGPALSTNLPGISSGRGLSASSANNLILQNTGFDNDSNYVFVNNVFEQFVANVSQEPSLLSNISFPPL